VRYPVLLFLVGLFVIKESFQLIAGGIALKKGKMLKGALLEGKICTTILFVSLIILVMIPDIGNQAVIIITVVDAVFMLISFIWYIFAYVGKQKMLDDIQDNSN
jgi:cardiolipin synthase